MSADSVSTSVFGATCPASTGAPGTGGNGNTALGAGPGETGAPKHAGTSQAQPQDLSPVGGTHNIDGSPVHHTLSENISNIVDQSNLPHGSVEASQVRPAFGADGMQTDTGAGSGSAGHNATGVNG